MYIRQVFVFPCHRHEMGWTTNRAGRAGTASRTYSHFLWVILPLEVPEMLLFIYSIFSDSVIPAYIYNYNRCIHIYIYIHMYIWQQNCSLKIKRCLFEINVIWDNEYRISRTSEVVTIVVQSNHADNHNHQNRVCISQTDTRLIFYGQWKDGDTNLPGFIAMNIKPFYAGPRTIILSNKRNYAWSKSEYLWNQRRYLYEIFWKSFSHRCKWFRIIFMSVLENDHGHCTLFVISKFILPHHETSWSGSFCYEGGSLYSETTENFFFRFALSVTRTSTPRLSGDHGLQDDGILEPGVLRSTVAAYFSFHRDTDLNLQEHCRMSFTACVCLRSHHKRAMSKWCGVYTRVIHLCNRFQTACAISLRWRHNVCDSVSNHQPYDYLMNRLFRHRSKKTSKLRITGLCAGKSPGPVNSPHKWPVTRKMSPFYDVIMS